METWEEHLLQLLETMTSKRRYNAATYIGQYNRNCVQCENAPHAVFVHTVNYSELWEFPEEEAEANEEFIQQEPIEGIARRLVDYKYPDLQNLFAQKILHTDKGISVLKVLLTFNDSIMREQAIYALLLNVFYVDRHKDSFLLHDYLLVAPPKYILLLFYNELYNYKGIYKEKIYGQILSNICSIYDMPSVYLRNNIGCILTVVEHAYAKLSAEQKASLLTDLDNAISTEITEFSPFNEAEKRVIKARESLIADIYVDHLQEGFEKELNSCEVRFEGWCIPVGPRNGAINYEIAVLFSWLYVTINIATDAALQELIVRSIYKRLQSQISNADHEDTCYRTAMGAFVLSLRSGTSLYDELLGNFIQETSDLYFVMKVSDSLSTIPPSPNKLLSGRWDAEKDVTLIKTNLQYLWHKDVENLTKRLGLKCYKL